MTTAAVFLDRDGVLNELVPDRGTGTPESPTEPESVRLVPGAAEAVKRFTEAGYLIAVVSNQPGAAKGRITRAALGEVHDAIVRAFAQEGAHMDTWRYCFHHPDAGDDCMCRKPKPGLILEAALEFDIDLAASWMIGDSDSDVEAGRSAGVRTVLILNSDSAHRRSESHADVTVPTLADAASVILGTTGR